MPDPNDKGGANGGDGGSGGGNPPAPTAKTPEQQLAEVIAEQKKQAASLQATQEELKRVNNLNGVLMQRLQGNGGQPPQPNNNSGMHAGNTIKLRRNFSEMNPNDDPGRFAEELVAETAEQVATRMAMIEEQKAQQASLRNAFYGKHKDLVGFELIVGQISDEVQRGNPGLPFDQAAELVAEKTREYVKSKGLSNPANSAGDPPHVLPPNNGGGTGSGAIVIKKPDNDKPYNPDDAYNESMKDYAQERNGERERTGTKSGKA